MTPNSSSSSSKKTDNSSLLRHSFSVRFTMNKGKWLIIVLLSLLERGSSAWLPSSRSPSSMDAASSSSSSSSAGESSRRQWLQTTVGAAFVGVGAVPLLAPPRVANAAELVQSTSVCDPSVSVWKKDGRLVYLLGTAHISSSSAALAGKLVQDIHPTGVFVELDAKRVSGSGILAKRVSTDGANEGLQSRVIVPQIQVLASSLPTQQLRQAAGDAALSSSSYAQAPTTAQTTSQTTSQPNPMMRAASIAVGNSIKGMYKKLDSAGFQAGEEFVVAIREGQLIGSDIVLGDRDVEVTLRRLTEGLTQTDLRALLNPDSELEQSLKELVPPATARGSGSGTSEVASNTDEQLREEFSSFVEVIKTKENVRKIMFQLQKAAPALYEALVSERDAYMAAGLNGLNELETIVAVMGIAHVDGVEQNLKLNGWNAVNPSSCK